MPTQLRLLACALACASALPSPGRAGVSRAALLRSASTALAGALAAPALAYDLPELTDFSNTKLRAEFASRANPGLSKQAGAAFYAITSGDLPTLKAMIDAGWDLNAATDTANKNSLHRAAQLGNAGAVKVLLDAGLPVDPVTNWKETPLHFAVRNGKLPVVEQLINAGADTRKETVGGDTPLRLAQKYRYTAIVDFLSSSK